MTVSVANHADVYTDFQGLARLRTAAKQESPEALREVARQFEALFLQMALKSMREAGMGEGLMDNDQSKLYQGMYDQQLGIELSKGKGLGLAESLVRQLGGRVAEPERSESIAARAAPVHGRVTGGNDASRVPLTQAFIAARATPAEGRQPAAATDIPGWESPQAFVQALWPHAEKAAAALGTRPEVLIAQSALETGWGKAVMQHADGKPSYNLFGIKADSRWDGDRVYSQTMEFRDGAMQRERAAFRSYDSLAAGFEDYVAFLKENPRYQQALEVADDGHAYVRELQAAGYATDPEYARKINAIMTGAVMADAKGGRHV